MILLLLTYWYIPALLILVAGIFVAVKWQHWFGDKGADPMEGADSKIAVANAEGRANEAELRLQAARDKQALLAKYADARKSLDAETEARIRGLEDGDLDELAAAFEDATRS